MVEDGHSEGGQGRQFALPSNIIRSMLLHGDMNCRSTPSMDTCPDDVLRQAPLRILDQQFLISSLSCVNAYERSRQWCCIR
eukprot:375130-Hanusia_phi.AAC.1